MNECCGQGPSGACRCYTDAASVAAAVRAFVRGRVAHRQDAEDITQETLLRLYRHVEDLRDIAAFDGWMYRIARNAITDHHRGAPRRPQPVDITEHEPVDVADEQPADELLSSCLQTLLSRVPDTYRRALELTDLGDLTQAQAAAQVGLTSSGMKSRVQRGRRLLRAEITHCCQISLDSFGGVVDATVRSDERDCLPTV